MKISAFSKTYEGTKVLDFPGMELQPGKIYAIIGANGSGNRLLNEVDTAAAGLNTCVNNGTLLNFGDAGGHADDETGLKELEAHYLADEFTQHTLGHVVVADDALAQGADGNDVAGGTPQHQLRFSAEFQYFFCIFIDCNNGGFSDHDPLTFDIHEDRGGPEVNSDVFAHSVITRTFRLEIQVKTLL